MKWAREKTPNAAANRAGAFAMALSDLAERVYQILRKRVPAEEPRLSYGQLVRLLNPLPPPNDNLTPSDDRLFDALGEICLACHGHKSCLPALSCIVIRKQEDNTLGTPGAGYYYMAHPGIHGDQARHNAWLLEYQRARNTTYPSNL